MNCVFSSKCKQFGTENCHTSCPKYMAFNHLLGLSNIDSHYLKLDNLKMVPPEEDLSKYIQLKDIKKNITNFVKNGNNLYICSETTGNGKTTWAVKLLLSYIAMNWKRSYGVTRGLFVKYSEFKQDIKNFTNPPEYLSRIKDADLLVLDDIAASYKLSDFEYDKLLELIDYRLNNDKSTIYTSNIVDYAKLEAYLDGRLASRIYNMSTVVKFDAKDYRVVIKSIKEDKKD